MILQDADRIFRHACKLLLRIGSHAPQFVLFYPDRIVPTLVTGKTRDDLLDASWALIRAAVDNNLIGYYFINEAWVASLKPTHQVVCARCGEKHDGRSTPRCARFIPTLQSGQMIHDMPDKREMLMMCAVTRAGRRMLQQDFDHEGKRIALDGEVKEVKLSFDKFGELLAEADRVRGAQ
jgi:hypothetical protein